MNLLKSKTTGRNRIAARVGKVLTATVLGLGVALVPMQQAQAHDVLIDTAPKADSTVKVLPGEVSVVMSADLTKTGAAIEVTGPDGERWDNDDTTVRGTDAVVTLKEGGPAGEYAVVWRVVSSDGHPVSGDFVFTTSRGAENPAEDISDDAGSGTAETDPDTSVSTGDVNPQADDPAAANPAVPGDSDSAAGSDTDGADVTGVGDDATSNSSDEETDAVADTADSDTNWLPTVLLVVVGVAIGVGIYFVASARRRRANSTPDA